MVFRVVTLLLPALIPSWRFFKEVAPSPRIEGRIVGVHGWRMLHTRPETVGLFEGFLRLFWNRQWNSQLFFVSLTERFLAGASDASERLLLQEVTKRLSACAGQSVAFRIWLVDRAGDDVIQEVVYESSEFEVGP